MSDLIFSLYIDIATDELDNPGAFDQSGAFIPTTKSAFTKGSFANYKDQLIRKQHVYAQSIGAQYTAVLGGKNFNTFAASFQHLPEISKYDIINFYKHFLMYMFSTKFDRICYMDLDVVPNTTENIFDAHPCTTHFCVPDSNKEAEWGKRIPSKDFNTCIRNPATKYWNAHAMLSEDGIDPERDVFNTGIMIGGKEVIHKLNYFDGFSSLIDKMRHVKLDPDSMYPPGIQRVFNYDNETLFSYLVASKGVPIHLMGDDWHQAVRFADYDPTAKMFHVIDKVFERFFP
jgi:hypothetical protein